MGMSLVFVAVFWEVISNYRQGNKKNATENKFSKLEQT